MAYIDRDKKIAQLQAKCVNCIDYDTCTNCHIDKIINELKNTPTADVVEVVRCKDCVAKKRNIEPYECTRNNMIVYGNCYCAFGIRKEVEQ